MEFQFYKFKIKNNLLSIIARKRISSEDISNTELNTNNIKYYIINVSIVKDFVNHTTPNKICIFMKSSNIAIPRFYDIIIKEYSDNDIKLIENIENYKPSSGIDGLIGKNLYNFLLSLLINIS